MGGADFQLLTDLAGKSTLLDLFGIFCSQYLPYIVALFFVALLLVQKPVRRRLQLSLYAILSLLIGYGLIGVSIEHFMFRPRPFVQFDFTPLVSHAATTSFPSNHAIVLFTLATIVFFSISRRHGTWMFVLATLAGLARVFVGLHFPLDIAAGALIGFATALLLRLVVPEFRVKPSTKADTEELQGP